MNMAITAGDICFTALMSDATDDSRADSFSFVATTNIAAGETITFHAPEAAGGLGVGDTFFTFTVGAAGLSAFDRVTITESATPDIMTILNDPSGGSVSGVTGNGWSVSDNDEVIAAQGGQVLAAIVNSSNNGSSWNNNLASTGLSTTDLDAFIAGNPTMSPIAEFVGGLNDNAVFSGTNILTQGSDPAFWVSTNDDVNHDTGAIGATSYATQDANITCFACGTLIATPDGEVAVETLATGDVVSTAEEGATQVVWLAKQTISHRHGITTKRALVRIKAGTLGNHSDLIVTSDHGMIVDGLVINASALVNGGTIDFVAMADVPAGFTVYHIETTAHDTVLANGAASETFVDAVGRAVFDNYQDYVDMYGAERLIPEMERTRVSLARLVPMAIKARLGIGEVDGDFDEMLSA